MAPPVTSPMPSVTELPTRDRLTGSPPKASASLWPGLLMRTVSNPRVTTCPLLLPCQRKSLACCPLSPSWSRSLTTRPLTPSPPTSPPFINSIIDYYSASHDPACVPRLRCAPPIWTLNYLCKYNKIYWSKLNAWWSLLRHLTFREFCIFYLN